MEAEQIRTILTACERALESGARADLRALGFWRAVGAVKGRAELTDELAERIAEIDRRAFLARVRLVFPLPVGVALSVVGAIVGLLLLVAAFALPQTLAGAAVLAAAGALVGTTHDLAHLAVGRAVGIRFTNWYSDLPTRPQPGVKIEYASYLRAPARGRAWMHASGAIVTKLVPFLLLPVALAAGTPWWTSAVLLVVGIAQLATDALFSVRSGDWGKFRRELRIAERASRRS